MQVKKCMLRWLLSFGCIANKFVYGVCIVFSKPHDTVVLAIEAIVVETSSKMHESSWF